MNLDLGGPGAGCSAMRVRRLLAGELSGVEKERTEALPPPTVTGV